MAEFPLKLVGAYGSPYSRKMRAVLRYRRIPHRWIVRGSREDRGIPEVPVALIPVLVFPGKGDAPDTAMIDSTFQIRRLEEFESGRSVIPPEPVTAFVDALIEDYADEWLTKAMFHYRWAFDPDVRKAAAILPRWLVRTLPEELMEALGRTFSERQIGRLGVVGSNQTTAPVIEASYRGLLRALDAQLRVQPFVMGARPGTADFGLFGQLSQLALFDPTSQALALEEAPRVVRLVPRGRGPLRSRGDRRRLDSARRRAGDAARSCSPRWGGSTLPSCWPTRPRSSAARAQVECEIDGRKWVQKPFSYQGKCLRWLREQYAALGSGDRSAVDALLAGTGCEVLFTDV